MEFAKREAHKQGLDGDPVTRICDTEQASVCDEEQAGCEGHFSADPDGERETGAGGLSDDVNPSAQDQDTEHYSNDSDKPHSEPSSRTSNASQEHRPSSGSSSPSDHHKSLHLTAEASDKQEHVRPQAGDSGAQVSASRSSSVWSDDLPPLQINHEALKHLATYFLPSSHGACVDITKIEGGSFHEIRVLTFEDGWTCIGRFTRDYEILHKTESELATMEFIRKHTSIPVPRVYYVNYNENHVVGAPFVLMERMQDERLCDVWNELTMEHMLAVVGQLADAVGQLAELKFDAVGSLNANGTLGPLVNVTKTWDAMGDDSFTSTMDYFFAFLRDDDVHRTAETKVFYPAIRDELRSFLEKESSNPTLHAPYRLIHGDLDCQNILILRPSDGQPPRISGVIDWDYSHTGLLYYLCDYPPQLLNWFDYPDSHSENKVLRKHFVASLVQHFPEGSVDRKQVKQCFREKSYILNVFRNIFMLHGWDALVESALVSGFLGRMRGEGEKWQRLPYDGVLNWEPDSDLEDSDIEDGSQSNVSEDSSGEVETGSSAESGPDSEEDSSDEK